MTHDTERIALPDDGSSPAGPGSRHPRQPSTGDGFQQGPPPREAPVVQQQHLEQHPGTGPDAPHVTEPVSHIPEPTTGPAPHTTTPGALHSVDPARRGTPRPGTEATGRDATAAPGTDASGARPEGAHSGPALLPPEGREALSLRMHQAVTDFVEDPRRAVEEADSAFDRIVADLTEALEERRRELRAGWHGQGTEARTEELRLALRRYRDAGDQLLRI
ncbi:hypothetical protein [Streptomyces griseus]|uniref:hypothetical protein n=1 Tax=Streptomyces griseus TaxID=1911 RepID=UPI0008402790|nr:hypothetical protein [Streptomyces griseus]